MNIMNCTRCELCGAAAEIFSSGSFTHYSLVFRVILVPICILGISALILAIYHTKSLHFNARLLLICLTVSMKLCNTGVFIDAVYKLLISFVMPEESRCEYQVFKPKYGLAIRGLHITGGMGIALSAMFLAVERTIATVNYITYEKEGRKLLGITFVITEIIISLGTMFYVRTPKQFYPYCAPELYNSRAAKLFGNILYGLNIAALITFTLLWIVNKQRGGILINIHLRILSTRYQLKENISTTLLMIPVMLVVTLMTTSSQLVYHLYMPEYDENTVITRNVLKELIIYAPYAEYQISLMPVLTLMMIILLPYFHKHIKRSFLRIASLNFYLPGIPNTVDIITVDEARELYFEKLRGQWRAKTSAMDLK